MLSVEGLRAGYRGVTALWDVSFSVAEGQVVALSDPEQESKKKEGGARGPALPK